jgi:outer membrane receptor protein involved in Fe transport
LKEIEHVARHVAAAVEPIRLRERRAPPVVRLRYVRARGIVADKPGALQSGYILNGVTEYLGAKTSVLFVQPEVRFAIDAGVRLFDGKLTVGARRTQVGETEPTIGTLQNNYKLDGYTIYDLYGSYAFDDETKLRFNVTNLTDVAYVSALGADYFAMPGRTVTGSFQVKY